MLLIIIFSVPSVQTYAAKKVTDDLNETYDTDIQIDRLGLNWKAELDIRKIFITDHHNDTLIYVNSLQTSILSIRNLINGNLDFDYADLSEAKLYVCTYKDETNDNLSIFAEKFDTGEKSETPFSLTSNTVSLSNSKIKITDYNLENPYVFDFSEVHLDADDFKITGPNIQAKINGLSLESVRGMSIKKLKADFSYSLEELALMSLDLESESSMIRGDITLKYGGKGMGDFENNVTILANLKNTELATDDLNAFYDEFGSNQTLRLDGDFEGTLNNFTFYISSLSTGNTELSGSYSFQNLLNEEETYHMSAKNHRIATNYYDMRRLMPRLLGDNLPKELKNLGNFTFAGITELTEKELETNSSIYSQIGSVKVDAKIGNINNSEKATYQGFINLNDFNLGKIAGTTSLGKISADLNIDGKGFTQEALNTQVSGTIASLNFEGYQYRNITLTGNLKQPIFNGELSVNDPNLRLNFKGLIDVSKKFNQYDFEADIEFAELNNLNLIERDSVSVFAGRVIMDMDGTTFDDAKGTILFKESFYQTEEDDFYFDDFQVISSFDGPIRTIEIDSPDIIQGSISGEFLVEDIPNLFRNGIGSIYANYIPKEVTTNQYIDYEFEIYNKIVELFVPQLKLGENTRVRGSVSSDESKFKLDFRSPEILLLDNYLGKVNVKVDNDNPIYNTYVSIDSIYSGYYDIAELNMINKTINDTLHIRSEFRGGTIKQDNFNLSLYHTINPQGKSVVGVKKSEITYKDNVWFINKFNNNLNKVVFDDNFKSVRIDSLVFRHNDEFIKLAGSLRDSSYKDIKLQFKDVNIGNIVPEVDSLRLQGNMNGRLHFVQKKKAYFPTSNVTIDGVVINEVPFGDLNMNITGNQDLTKYKINTTLINDQVKSINAIGEIDVSMATSQIKMDIDLNDFNLQALSPFGEDVITDIRGNASGNVLVRGAVTAPELNGLIRLKNSGMKIPYLNTDFNLDNSALIQITSNKLEIEETSIVDSRFGTKGTISGNAKHSNFKNWELDLTIDAPDRLLVLNTPPDEDALYYGTCFISGNAKIYGPINELIIDVVATTEEGTTFKIPLSDTESIGDDSFIKFLSPAEKEARISGEIVELKEITGLSLNFELDINEKAEVEVMVDPVNKSTLKGRGAGILLIEINTLGKFRMWGDFLVISGEYDFRYGGIIQKNIEVVSGGSINWQGDPARAMLNLSALYKTEANPSILLDNPAMNRKIPVNVLVDLTGELIQPEINFRIDFPRVSSIVQEELEYKLQNEEQREKQAMFLIASNSFVNDDFQGSGAFGSAIAERVNSLVADIFAQKDSKFKVLPYIVAADRTYDQDNGTELGVQITTQINERILINGKVGVPVGGVNETVVAGDIELQWLVNKDGTLRINFFNRQADVQFIGEDQIFEQGSGISYMVDFDTFRELLNKLFNRKVSLESENELLVIPDDNSPSSLYDK